MVFNSIKIISIKSLSHAIVLVGLCAVGHYSRHCAVFVWCHAVGQNRGLLSFLSQFSIRVISIKVLSHAIVLLGLCAVVRYNSHYAVLASSYCVVGLNKFHLTYHIGAYLLCH